MFGFLQAVPPKHYAGLDGSVPSVCRPYRKTIKSVRHCGARPCLFFCLLILLVLPTAKPPDVLPAGCPQVRRAALRCEPTIRAISPCRSCMPCKYHTFTAQLVLGLCVSYFCPSRLATWPLAITLSCPVALARPQTLTKASWLNPVLGVIVSNIAR